METIPTAKLVEIKIVEVPFQWKELSQNCEYGSEHNRDTVKLIHKPSGTEYSVKINEQVLTGKDVVTIRAKSKLKFMYELLGESHLFDWEAL